MLAPDRTLRRLLVGVVALSSVWLLAVGLWEIGSPFGAGHVAVLPARGIMADNMLRWGILYPVRDYTWGVPDKSLAYVHHPWGTYYLFTLFRAVLGRHEWVLRLVPVLVNAAIPVLLYRVASGYWGRIPGVLAALTWGVLPITLAFAQFPSFELFSTFAVLLGMLGALRWSRGARPGWLAVLLLGVLCMAHADWMSLLFLVLGLAWVAIGVALAPPKVLDETRLRRTFRVLLLVGFVAVISGLLYVWWIQRAGLLTDLLDSAKVRSQGRPLSLGSVLAHRRFWLESMFTKLGLLLVMLGAGAQVFRLLRHRRWLEGLPILWLATGLFHYLYFTNGADVHIYWPFPLASHLCLGVGAMSAVLGGLKVIPSGRSSWRRRVRTWSYAKLGGFALLVMVMLPDALRALDYSRASGCRLNDDGWLNLQDHDKALALDHFRSHLSEGRSVTFDASMQVNWSSQWNLDRPTIMGRPSTRSVGFTSSRPRLLDTRFADAFSLMQASSRGSVRVLGPFWLVDPVGPRVPLGVEGFEESSPTILQRLLVQAHDPIRRVVKDPFGSWELAFHLGLPFDEPFPPAQTLEQKRIAHNRAVASGNQPEADRWRAELLRELDVRTATEFSQGVALLGHRLTDGVVRRLDLLFAADQALLDDCYFSVESRVLRAPRLSLVMADDKLKSHSAGFDLPTSLWRTGMLYSLRVELRKRPGREIFWGRWRGGPGRAVPSTRRGDPVVLFTLP